MANKSIYVTRTLEGYIEFSTKELELLAIAVNYLLENRALAESKMNVGEISLNSLIKLDNKLEIYLPSEEENG